MKICEFPFSFFVWIKDENCPNNRVVGQEKPKIFLALSNIKKAFNYSFSCITNFLVLPLA